MTGFFIKLELEFVLSCLHPLPQILQHCSPAIVILKIGESVAVIGCHLLKHEGLFRVDLALCRKLLHLGNLGLELTLEQISLTQIKLIGLLELLD